MPTVSNVTNGKPKVSGAAFIGDTTAALPTDVTTALTGFDELGYISEDGLRNTNSPSTENIRAWGGDIVLSVQNEKTDTFRLTLIEVLNPSVLKAVHGDANVTGTLAAGITVKANADDPDEKAWVFDTILRDGALKRIVLPRAKVTEIGEITYSDSAAVGYDVTLTAMADASGNTHYEYIQRN